MREEVIDILAMISPTLDVEDEEFNIGESLDSDEMKTLIAELEDKFGIEITSEENTEENFESVDALIEMIERLQ